MKKFAFLLLLFTFFSTVHRIYAAKTGDIILHVDSVAHVSCFGGNDGAIFLTVFDDGLSYVLEWSNGDTSLNPSNLPAGTYSLTLTDADGDVSILEGIEILQPEELAISLAFVELPDCAGQPGAIEASVQGGAQPYQYAWASGQTTALIDGLSAGDYELTVTDANGCSTVFSYLLEPEYPLVSLVSNGNITCAQQVVTLDGTASYASGGFSYSWIAENGGQFISTTDSLVVWADAAGSYTLEISDLQNGCTSLAGMEITVDTLLPLADAGSDLELPCTNSEISIGGDGSTGLLFSYEWEAINGGNILEGENTLSPLVNRAGSYILTVKNLENDCVARDTMTLVGLNEPPVAVVNGGTLNCLTTEIQLVVENPLSHAVFEWTGPEGFFSEELSPSVSVAGAYILFVVDTLTTCADAAVAEVFENTNPPFSEINGGVLTCANSTVTLSVTATSEDVVFSWFGPNGFASSEQNPVVDEVGEYTLEAEDTLTGCYATAIVIVDVDTLAPTADAGTGGTLTCAAPSLQLDGSASSQGDHYAYLWTTSDGIILSGEETLSPEVGSAGVYTLTVANLINGCTATDEPEVLEDKLAPVVEAIGSEITCFEPNTQLFGIFDTAHVSFIWEGPNGFSSSEQNPLVSEGGDFLLTVTDSLNGCPGTATATVIAFTTAPELTLTVSDTITCNITEATLTVGSQLPEVVYAWSGPNGYQSGDSIIVVSEPGIYTVLAIELVYGCIALDSIALEADLVAPIADAGAGFNLDCHVQSGFLDGSLSSQGGNFTYSWTTLDGNIISGENTLTPELDAAGVYTLTVVNIINGCASSDETEVVQIAPVTAEISELSDVSCHGGADGSATVEAGGGVGSYAYAWSNGSLSATTAGLIIGSYSVTVADESNCTAEATILIGQPDLLAAKAVATAQNLANIDDGTAAANPDGGTPPYSFEWSNGDTTQVISDLAPGPYTVIVTDANGCTAIETVNVNLFDCALTGSISATNASCFGVADGTAGVYLENETAPIQFSWSNGDSLPVAANLAAGIYHVTITDSTNCSIILTAGIAQPNEIVVAELAHEDLACPTEQNGSVTVAANGGAQPYAYTWFDGSEGNAIGDLSLGDYGVTVTDADGCEATYIATIASYDNEPPVLVLQSITTFLDGNGQANIAGEMLDAGSFDNCGIAAWSVTPDSFDCSQTGNQTVIVSLTDLNGNESSSEIDIVVLDTLAPELLCPDDMVISACNAELFYNLPAFADNCSFDLEQLQLTEGLPSGSAFPPGLTTQVFSYTDASGNSGECSFTVEVVEGLSVDYSLSHASCAGACDGSIELFLSNGLEPYSILWSNGATSENLNDLCAGFYVASITDGSGCSLEVSFEIEEPEVLVIGVLEVVQPVCAEDASGEISVEIAGGVQPYQILWSNGSDSTTADKLLPGNYLIEVTDGQGCTVGLEVAVSATDSLFPVLSLQDLTVQTGEDGSVNLNASDFDAGSADNCGIAFWTVSPESFGCEDLGTHTVTITATDGNGNSSSAEAQVTIVDNLAPTLTCPGNISVGYCAPLVSFVLPQINDNCTSDPTLLQQTTGLPSGSSFPSGSTLQTFTYTDASGNIGSCSFVVTVGTVAEITPTINNAPCFGQCDGEISLAVNGGHPPYTIVWSNGLTGSVAGGLCAGEYTASVTDASSCLQIITTSITQPAPLEISVDLVNNDIGGAGHGAVFISVSGGTAPYSFQWTHNGSNFSSSEDLLNITSGLYKVTVKDANGCEISSADIAVENISRAGEPLWSGSLVMSPNPASEWVQFSFENTPEQEVEVVFIDAAGRRLSAGKIANGQKDVRFEISGFAPGFYLVQLRTADDSIFRRLSVIR